MPHPIGGSSKGPSWRRYLRFWRADIAGDIDDELRFHFEMRAEELRATGVSPEEIAHIIAEEFGDAETARQRMREIDARIARRKGRAQWWHHLTEDVRYALRGLRRSPSFAIAVIVTLALGSGANAAIFSVIDRMLVRAPAMMRDPAGTHRVYIHFSPSGLFLANVPYARYRDLSAWSRSVDQTALYADRDLAIGNGENGHESHVGIVSASFFDFFDAPPALGRYFNAQEDAPPSGVPVAVLGYGVWQATYAGRSDVLGRQLRIGSVVYTVIGVAPRGFVGLWPARPPAAFVPFSTFAASLSPEMGGPRGWIGYGMSPGSMLVHRRPGITIVAANADLTQALLRSWEAQTGGGKPPAGSYAVAASILSDRGPNRTAAARVAALVAAMGLIILIIAGANVANLLLARALRRRREIATRLALGASRGRLASQLLVESVLLALLGGAAGVLVAEWGGSPLRRAFLPTDGTAPVMGDMRTLIVVGIAVTIIGMLAGLASAGSVHRSELTRYLRGNGDDGVLRKTRLRATLVIIQVALSVVLLVGAGLFLRSLVNVRRLPLGYDVAPILVGQINMRGMTVDDAHAVALRANLLAAARRMPGVEHAALNFMVPLHDRWLAGFRTPGMDSSVLRREHEFYLNAVGPDYFATMGTRIIRGRGIEAVDAADAPGAIVVSNALATLVWPGKDAIGQCVRINADRSCRYVVGVAEDIKNAGLGDAGFDYYLSAAQFLPQWMKLVVRTHGDGAQKAEAVRQALQKEMPGASYVTVTPFADLIAPEMHSWQLGTTMFITYGVLALVLAAVGLAGVIAYQVEQRTREVGVRIALGAAPTEAMWLIVRKGILFGAIGVGIGCVAALAASPRLAPLLFDESASDPLVYAGVAAVLVLVAILASLFPARRAASVDPVVALRSE